MASGYFPIAHWQNPEAHAELSAIADRLDAFTKEWMGTFAKYGDLCSLTPEDAAYDGGYLERLRIAHGFIRDCLKTEPA